MAKREALMPLAEELYVGKLYNIQAVADKLGVSEKTIRTWKQAGGWEQKRRALMQDTTSIADGQRAIAVRILELINKLLDAGEEVPRHYLSYLVQVGSGAAKARDYELSSAPDPAPIESEKPAGPSAESIRQAMEILGWQPPQ
jgi:hypothetical protein